MTSYQTPGQAEQQDTNSADKNPQEKKGNGLLSGGKYAGNPPSSPGTVAPQGVAESDAAQNAPAELPIQRGNTQRPTEQAQPASSSPQQAQNGGQKTSNPQSLPGFAPQAQQKNPQSLSGFAAQAKGSEKNPKSLSGFAPQAQQKNPQSLSGFAPLPTQNPATSTPQGPPENSPIGGASPRGSQSNPQSFHGLPPQGPAGNSVQQARPQAPQQPVNQAPQQRQVAQGQGAPPGPTGNVVLYRSQHFYVRTTIHPNKQTSTNPLRKPTGSTTMMPKVNPNQENRVAASDTRMLPSVETQDAQKKKKFYVPSWIEAVIIFLGLAVSLIAHAYNMFGFPRYEMDEGTYMGAAWAILNGKIYQYAYGYGHPPFAWMQLAGLVQLFGGFFTFGNAINTGRVLMLLYTAGSTLLIYLIVRKMGGSRAAGLLAMVIFALSPLAITYQRLVLLDNIAVFWLLLSLYLLAISRSRLSLIALSAICFGLSMLSKEVFVLFMPGMVYAVWLHSTRFQRKFALVAFVYSFLAVASSFLLLAVLKGELFPYEWHLPWDKNPHLSLIGTFIYQAGRGKNEGDFAGIWNEWLRADPLLIVLSIAPLAFNLAVGWWRRKQLLFAILGISFWLLLIRGGVVLSFYFIPIIPLTAINAALMVNTLGDWVGKFVRLDLLRAFLVFCALAGVVVFDLTYTGQVYSSNVTKVQTDTLNWVRMNVPRNSYVVMNSYLYMDLKAQGGAAVGDGATFPNAEVYINIATDPDLIRRTGGNWDNVDYIIADSQIEDYILRNIPPEAKFLQEAMQRASVCADFKYGSGKTGYEIKIYCVQHSRPGPVVSTPPTDRHASLIAEGTMPTDRRELIK